MPQENDAPLALLNDAIWPLRATVHLPAAWQERLCR